ncbi:MAG: aldehyde ferredoxin oxidoreductase family protein [Nitrososphaeria archaeon]|nr:aldehyde ferredoxin oxidoreductase family protein [Nitrososphaeria archaeon]
MYCYTGRVLRINLSTSSFRVEEIRREFIERYIGGRGLGIRYLLEEVPPRIDPLSPDNKIIIPTGPLTGTIAPLSGRFPIVTKSPLTNTVCDSYSGSFFAVKMKYAGYDLLIVEGRASKPSYIEITENGAVIRDASHLWGLGTLESSRIIKEELRDENSSVLTIGPAGENLVRFACVVDSGLWVNGRGGVGAVFGSKNLKALAIKNYKGEVKLYDPEGFKNTVVELTRKRVKTAENLWAQTDGTPIIVDLSHNAGVLPSYGFRSGSFEYHDKINTERVKEATAKKYACPFCPLACKRILKFNNRLIKSPEYETLSMMGSNLGVRNLKDVAEAAIVATDLGMDTISLGSIIGFTVRLYEEKILSEKDLNGLKPSWNSLDFIIEMSKMIAYRRGIGDKMAEGVRRAVQKIGEKAEKERLDVKGLELPAYDPRGTYGMALAYATADRGGCHLRAWAVASDAFGEMDPYSFTGKAKLVKDLQDLNSIKWSLIICDFWLSSYEDMAKLLKPALGREYSVEELKIIGERIWNLTKIFNMREGFKRIDDTLPPKMFEQPLRGGKTDGKVVPRREFEESLSEYYKLRGWDESTGIPKEETLKKLGVDIS